METTHNTRLLDNLHSSMWYRTFGQRGAVVDGANAILTASLAQAEARGTGVRDNVAANGLCTVLGKAHAVCV